MHPLDGVRLKLGAAHAQTEALHAFLKNTCKVDADGIRCEPNPKTGQFVYYANKTVTVDPMCGVRIGEIGHNLRSALDCLTWQVALLNVRRPYDKTQFPIYRFGRTTKGKRKLASYAGGRAANYLQSVAPALRSLFERVQPYKRPYRRGFDPLWLLHEMNNIDKHKLPHLVALVPTEVRFEIPTGNAKVVNMIGRGGRPFKEGVEIGSP